MFLVTYTLTVKEKLDIRDGIEIDLENKVTFTAIEDNDLIGDIFSKDTPDCGFSFVFSCWEVPCEIDGCMESQYTTTKCGTTIEYGGPCGGGGGVTGTGDNGDGSTHGGVVGAGGGTGDGTGLNEDPNAPVTVITPPAPTPIAQIVNCIPSILNNGLTTCLQENKSQTGALNDYLINNSCDTQAQGFGAPAAQAICDGGEVDFDDKIILDPTFTNNPTLMCVYNKLAADGSQLFKIAVESFEQNAEFNLTLMIGNCTFTDDACANTSELSTTGNITIIIEDINTNPIQLAQLILHEAIHAELARYVLQYESGADVNDRPYLFALYKYYKDLYDNNSGEIDHIYMTSQYIIPIADALKKFDNNSYPIDYYKSFAWDGLRAWDASNILGDDEEDSYNSYKPIVIQNSDVCN
ncbi:hypothetical protein N7U66_10520 [Lacinutrix neustonica]|uniref:Uncharacterized protein n=1 Tax=Lacinutrix neustonica TaxID=2980107 RepID=A0A9E8MZM8_9FLAO|nr:hypothetical protein [Lacinutrix neustonica]WAC03805.1 hypothetical protein N7U66_10520 [Lacinutrix neustonica]